MSKFWIVIGYVTGVGVIASIIYSILNAEYLNAIGLCFFFYFVWLALNMKKYTLLFIALFIFSCSSDKEESPFYVADNGVTIKARDWVTVGMTADLNGETYTAVDVSSLKEWMNDGKDLSKVVTTKVETTLNTPTLFLRTEIKGIESWDVSNWTSMEGLFYSSNPVKADLSNWDVSNVTNMGSLSIGLGDVNPGINNWNVSKVKVMSSFFGNTNKYFEGIDLSGWDVSKVTSCKNFYSNITDWPESKKPNFTNCNPDGD